MPLNIQTLPLALNYWRGNQFVPAPVQWAPTPPPAYQSLLEAPTVTGQPSPAQQALGIDAGYQGGQPSSAEGQGLNAQSPSFGSFVGSALTGPVGAFGSFMGQSLVNELSGNPSRTIDNLGIVDTARSIAEALGLDTGGSGTQGGVPGFDAQTGMAPGVGPEPAVESAPLGDIGGAGTGGTGGGADYGSAAQEAAESGGYQGSGMYAKGGMVRHLLGPNPPGPDDGYAGLDKGEHVITAKQARKYRGLLDAINEEKPKKKLRGLLG